MTKKIALPLIIAATLGLAACHKADTSTENSVDINETTNDATADINAADASTMGTGNDVVDTTSTTSTGDNAMSGGAAADSMTTTTSTTSKNTDFDSAAGNATTDATHNKE